MYDEKAGGARPGNGHEYDIQEGEGQQLHRLLKGRHMQMIAIGGAIGAGLFVGSGSAFSHGGPASVVLCFIIIGCMLLLVMQALAELAVMYPVNGAFFTYCVRFINPAWGFACGWDYAIQWLTILPFEITAAGLTIAFWPRGAEVNIGVWVAVFLVALSVIQIFGIRGYGEVEFVLSTIKVLACTGFIILGIIINCGGVPSDPRGYIGGYYWHEPGGTAFRNGFQGFCAVFVTASFAFGGTELTGLAAAEAENPLKSIPLATKQVFWRITFFYVICLLLVGLNIPSGSDFLLNSSGANTKYSPFVYVMTLANIKVLPSIFNVVITVSVLSVANSCSFGSTRTLQALAAQGMAPKFFSYIDKHGRPYWCVVLQLVFGLLAFCNEATNGGPIFFNWLLALSGLANFFIWGSICFAHIRFRAGWQAQGHSLAEIPYKAPFGVWGSWTGLILNMLCIMAAFYNALYGVGGTPNASGFFQSFLAAPMILALYLFWKIYTRDFSLFIAAKDMDVTSGIRMNVQELIEATKGQEADLTWKTLPMRALRSLF
ncbi:hypothetical protein BAUCODRAFT_69625 [Baudoinia panamericana UAMH 10762]|uniref:Amino acid permease/ SLC12A domain-containing protein n=1 Tax=Baudoinia panamericana (strain UAMH 10762) TaxID=717646 RepID=M2NB96_BAUPA|nr:uncharacterized protein BAUCODRAFT_69625 [Baudoinia panamericana UAMH 10762]EMC96424.1 hypothetical protein BAUCODRAFT_69625 [Baudoinia panamericana UAMH 10762]